MREAANPRMPEDASSWRIPFLDGDLICHVSGAGQPILLVHSINAAASSCEMAALAEHLSADRRVYNLDLPGFGASDRPDVRYDMPRFVAAIETVTAAIRSREGGDRPIDAVALSLSCEFLARCAVNRPDAYRKLALISPTGFQKGANRLDGGEGETLEMGWAKSLFESRSGPLLFALLRRPSIIRFFLRRTFGRRDIDERVYRGAVATTRVPGAEHAPLAFLTFRLFSADIMRVYQRLEMPVLLAHGTRGQFSDFSNAGWTARRPNWRIQVYESGAMPNVELVDTFAADLRAHLA